MKPFNLERAIAGDPVIMRDGCKVIDFKKWNLKEDLFSIHALTTEKGLTTHTSEGFFDPPSINNSDLFMASNRRKFYILIEEPTDKNEVLGTSLAYEDKNRALKLLNEERYLNKMIEIEVEE